MASAKELSDKVDALAAEVETANGKADTLIALVADLRNQIAELSASGGATPAELDAIAAKVDAAVTSLQAQEGEDDAAGTPPA